MLNFNNLHKIHFIGICGVSLSSLALLMKALHIEVSGSDREFSDKLIALEDKGCSVYVGSDIKALQGVDLVVFSSAVKDTDEELSFARNHGIPCMERYVFLREVSLLFDNTVAIAGTHGKTTTTSMLAKIFRDAGLPFYAHIGGESIDNGNFFYSGNRYFLTEACEYKRSLLSLQPTVSVILNAEADHPDTYSSLADVYDTFDAFAEQSKICLINGDCNYYQSRRPVATSLTFGEKIDDTYRIENADEYKNGYFGCEISYLGIPLCKIKLIVPGRHNLYNAAAAVAVSHLMKLCPLDTADSLNSFRGVSRRFEYCGMFCSAYVYTDYAHHPSEIKATISTAKELLKDGSSLYVVFQPHTYSRTKSLFNDFLLCFNGVDKLIMTREYSAREKPSDGMSALELFSKLPIEEKKYIDNTLDIAQFLMANVKPYDIVLILGAGNINNLAKVLCVSP